MTLTEELRGFAQHGEQYGTKESYLMLLRCLALAEAVERLAEPECIRLRECDDELLAAAVEKLKDLIK